MLKHKKSRPPTGAFNLRLVSDFTDSYDHAFDLYGEPMYTFRRISTEGMDKIQMLRLLTEGLYRPGRMDYTTPRFGTVTDLYEELVARHFTPDASLLERRETHQMLKVVVVTDVRTHRGEGKLLLSWEDALREYPEAFGIEYLPCSVWGGGASVRMLHIGKRAFVQEFVSQDDWRSNCGNVHITTVMEIDSELNMMLPYPLYAVDFIPTEERGNFAIDFNIAPGVKGTGLEAFISPAEMVAAIKEACREFAFRSPVFCAGV